MTKEEWEKEKEERARTVPVQGGTDIPPGRIPWALHLLAYEEYYKHHKSQTAERLAERGGFSWAELVACLRGDYTHEGNTKAYNDLKNIQRPYNK